MAVRARGEISGGDALWDFLRRRGRIGFGAGNEKQLTVKAARLFFEKQCAGNSEQLEALLAQRKQGMFPDCNTLLHIPEDIKAKQ